MIETIPDIHALAARHCLTAGYGNGGKKLFLSAASKYSIDERMRFFLFSIHYCLSSQDGKVVQYIISLETVKYGDRQISSRFGQKSSRCY